MYDTLPLKPISMLFGNVRSPHVFCEIGIDESSRPTAKEALLMGYHWRRCQESLVIAAIKSVRGKGTSRSKTHGGVVIVHWSMLEIAHYDQQGVLRSLVTGSRQQCKRSFTISRCRSLNFNPSSYASGL